VSVNAANSTMSGAYPIKIVATGGGLQRTAAVVLMVNGPSTSTAPHPTPPQLYVDTTWNPPSGTLWPAHDSNGFANALAASQPGDTIVLDAGTVYTGNFTPPARTIPTDSGFTSSLRRLPACLRREQGLPRQTPPTCPRS
jgi:hypothetical protein